MPRKLVGLIVFAIAAVFSTTLLAAEEVPRPQPTVSVEGTLGDGKRILRAQISGSDPVEGLTVSFFAKRLFGLLPLGETETDKDGSAGLEFPGGLPGDSHGNVEIVARVEVSKSLTATGHAVVRWGIPVPAKAESFPRALWSPQAPRGLVWTIIALLMIVWSTYGFVVYHLIQIPTHKHTQGG